VSDALDRKLAGLKAVSSQLTQISSEASIIYDATTNKPMDLATQSSKILARYRELVQLDETQEALHQKVNFAHPSPAGDEPLEEDQQHLSDRPDSQMAKYSRAINLLTQAKTHTFLAELADKAPVELEKDEGLVEVLNHLTSKGKSAAPNPVCPSSPPFLHIVLYTFFKHKKIPPLISCIDADLRVTFSSPCSYVLKPLQHDEL
jgi:hypothetical protein